MLKKIKDLTIDEIENICNCYHKCEDCPLDATRYACIKNLEEDVGLKTISRLLEKKVEVKK